MLNSFTKGLGNEKATSFKLMIANVWMCRWPRLSSSTRDTTVDVTLKGGKLDITEALQLNSVTTKLWFGSELREFIQEDATERIWLDIVPAFACVISRKEYKPLVGQVLWYYSVCFDRAFGKGLNAGHWDSSSVTELNWEVDGEDVIGIEADHYVAKYVNGSVIEMQDKTIFGVATDKGMINKLPLMNTCIGAHNTVAVACPNVSDRLLLLLCTYIHI